MENSFLFFLFFLHGYNFMIKQLKKIIFLFTYYFLIFDVSHALSDEKKFMVISTGPKNSEEYLIGSNLCNLVNNKNKETGIYCSIIPSSGSIMNIDRLRRGNADFALVVDSKIIQATAGSHMFANHKPYKDLRVVITPFKKSFSFVVSKESNINNFSDLINKNTIVQSDADGNYETAEVVNKEGNITYKLISKNLGLADLLQDLCTNKIQVVSIKAAYKNKDISKSINECNSKIISVPLEVINKIVTKNPIYTLSVIPGSTYVAGSTDLLTFSEGVSIITNKNTDNKLVEVFVDSILSQISKYRNSTPYTKDITLINLKPKSDILPLFPNIENKFDF
jgi:TRAP transporter TAXI family solute receptor